MQLLLKLLLILQTGVQGIPLIEGVTQPRLVSVRKGESITINCTFIQNGSDGDWVWAYWYRSSPGASDIVFQDNFPTCIPNITRGVLRRCVSLLKIANVSFHHSDNNYTCVVKAPSSYPPVERKGQGTRIQIYGPPEVSTVDGALVAGRRSNLTCSAKGWYSEGISFTWACHGTNICTNVTTLTSKRTGHGTSVATSQLEIVPKVSDHGSVCSCQINHVTFRQPVINEIKLHVMYGPQDPTIMYRLTKNGSYHPGTCSPITVPTNSFLELSCSVDSNPASSVIWVKDGENHTEMFQLAAGLNSSKLKISHFQPEVRGVYWCLANNSYGRGNASVSIEAEQEGHWYFSVLVPLIALSGFIAAVTIYFYLNWKRQLKDPANESIELRPETVGRRANCNSEMDTVYAIVKRKSMSYNLKHPTEEIYVNDCNSVEEEDEEVPYADIVIYNPKRPHYNQQLKQVPDITKENTRKDFKYIHGSSPHKQVDDASEYSAIRVSRQDLRTA